MRWIALVALVGCAAAGAAEANSARVPELSAEQIVDVPIMQFVLQLQRPNRMRFEINAMGQRSARVFDGKLGWKQRAGQDGRPEVKPYTMQEVAYASRAPGIDGALIDYKAKRNSVALEGLDEIEGHKAYRLKLTQASGETDHVWVDARTFLELRYDRPSYAPGDKSATVTVMYRDYRDTDGLQIPFIVETGAASGQTPDRMVIEKVTFNMQLDDRLFASPEVRARRHSGLSMNRPKAQPAFPVPAEAPVPAEPAAPPSASSPDPGPASGSK
jgi:outer membrane lipoprotein-sorting protein